MLGCGGGGGRLRWRWSREQLPRSSTHGDICFSSQGYTGLAGSATQIVLTLRPCIQVPPPLMAQWWTHTHAHTSLFITHKTGQVAQCSSRHRGHAHPCHQKERYAELQRQPCTHQWQPHLPFCVRRSRTFVQAKCYVHSLHFSVDVTRGWMVRMRESLEQLSRLSNFPFYRCGN